jgi:hypothetical protein
MPRTCWSSKPEVFRAYEKNFQHHLSHSAQYTGLEAPALAPKIPSVLASSLALAPMRRTARVDVVAVWGSSLLIARRAVRNPPRRRSRLQSHSVSRQSRCSQAPPSLAPPRWNTVGTPQGKSSNADR